LTRPATPSAVAPAPQASEPGERLAKRVAALLACSRREAEQYIEGGWVQVDGVVVEEPQFRVERQTIAIDPDASLLALAPVTLLLNKPAGVPWDQAVALLNAASHWAQDGSATHVLKHHFRKLECAVPLETGATGLMAFTQDWRTQRKLVEDLGAMEHELIAEVAGAVTPEALALIERLLRDEHLALPLAKVSVNSATPERSRLRFAVKGAHPGLVAHLCEQARLPLTALRRIRLGRVALSDLPLGQWRYSGIGERF